MHLRITATEDAPRGHTATFLVHVHVTAEGTTGTHETPKGATAMGTITVTP